MEESHSIFVLKFMENEEYLYGDYLIGAYNSVRVFLRQHETVNFYLKIIPIYIVEPPLMAFPPILPIKSNEKVDYIYLLKKYLKNYVNKEIIYRMFKPGQKEKIRFIKQKFKRDEYLCSFNESCDCYYPLYIKILRINNLFKLKDWFDDENYNKNEMLIPNFKFYPKKNQPKKKKCFFFCNKKTDEEEISQKEKIKRKENSILLKTMSQIMKKNKKDSELQKKLNRLKIIVKYPLYYEYGINTLTFKNIFSDLINQHIDFLSQKEEKLREEDKIPSSENSNKYFVNLIDFFYNLNPKFKVFSLDQYILPFTPPFIRIKISLLYGCYTFFSFKTEPFLLNDNILINQKLYFDQGKCLISNLPFETRIGFTLEAYDRTLKKYFVLGSCQIPIYKSTGQMQNGSVTMNFWPNASISPRFNNCTSFNLIRKKKVTKKNLNDNLINKIFPEDSKPYLDEIMNKLDFDFLNIVQMHRREKKFKEKKNNIVEYIRNYEEKQKGKKSMKNNHYELYKTYSNNFGINANYYRTKRLDDSERNPLRENSISTSNMNLNINLETSSKKYKDSNDSSSIDDDKLKNTITNTKENIKSRLTKKATEAFLKEDYNISSSRSNFYNTSQNQNINENYCSITIQFPNFSSPLIYSQNASKSYRDYLEIKYKNNENLTNSNDDFKEIRKLYGNSQKDINFIVEDFSKNDFLSEETSLNTKNIYTTNQLQDKYPRNIWDYLKKTLPLIVQILKKDPLEALTESEITALLICRDYISTIPSALELFLRAIDWLNPLQVSIAHSYIKKWAKLEVEDAISLLDARFPDTETREFAISMLRNCSDDLISMYMLQLCQCLLYETFLINPLSDFLIERSLSNPKLIGNSFFWNSRVSMKNPLFADRLSVYLIQILMLSGEKYLSDCFNGLYLNNYLEMMTYWVKIAVQEKDRISSEKIVEKSIKFFEDKLQFKNFTFPIDPTYFGINFYRKYTVFNSKMLPIKIIFYSREKDKKTVIFKIGDDLRQDVLTLQIFRIMDKLWLDNNLDLKVFPYKVCPTELRAGFIECLTGIELDKLQSQQGVSGALNRDLIVQKLRGDNNTNEKERDNRFDNFIQSLAGYCVATCVIGIGDRHPGNIMIKDNGIFFHIDFGHILGNFKKKFGIQRERSPFLLTPEMANVYCTYNKEEYFKTACVKAFNILRHNAQRLINMFIIMSTAGMPELCGMNDVKYLKEMLVLDKASDEDAGNYFIGLIKKSKNDRFRLIDNMIHNWKHK